MSLCILNKSVSSLGCIFYLHLLEKKGKVEELKKIDAEDFGETEGKVECHWSHPQWGLHIWFPITFILVQRLEVAAVIMWGGCRY